MQRPLPDGNLEASGARTLTRTPRRNRFPGTQFRARPQAPAAKTGSARATISSEAVRLIRK
jgi:hypothetical protein